MRLRVDAQMMKSDLNKPEDFSLWGLRKDIRFYFDPQTRLPLKTDGYMPMLGEVEVKLSGAQLIG